MWLLVATNGVCYVFPLLSRVSCLGKENRLIVLRGTDDVLVRSLVFSIVVSHLHLIHSVSCRWLIRFSLVIVVRAKNLRAAWKGGT